ncbi:outer membrane lipid asymmetry maintenance protein MlaD [Rickettsiales endosymbiont of Peranema trichophorum]|uniref:outer membrane lipid asymmetry maintenance protein MlaD n=1 Tax=Rickettsiales endosymbiont of Peranema trichophorum TaxID=2486577 RepID=UPI00102340B6|nr:outer membrane lipid asymmetry maintenance protein MlaD [Rickettsiales endosymbiont of Peranema trichophorum]RZI45247.1 outer membrane lipid asymmetry maintenance protein MlaD [Rickettsiales endosymbiont of Peranema trichophorum]
MQQNFLETVVGFVVLLIAFAFVAVTYKSGSLNTAKYNGYKISAHFQRVDGIGAGSDVKLSGVKIGKVLDATINTETFDVTLDMGIENKYQIPVDSSAEIISNGFLGDKYVNIVPGSDTQRVKNNGVISFTQSSISLESLIAKFMFGNIKKHDEGTTQSGIH